MMNPEDPRYGLVAIVLAVVVVIAARTYGTPQEEISDDVGRAHAVAFRNRQTGRPIPRGQEIHELLGTPFGYPNQPAALSDDDLHLRLCSAEAVAVVRIVERRAFLTDDSSFVFTVYRARLLRVIKPSDTVAPSLETITFARPGGSVKLADESINVRLDTFPSLQSGREVHPGASCER